jgi:hypothetical protein
MDFFLGIGQSSYVSTGEYTLSRCVGDAHKRAGPVTYGGSDFSSLEELWDSVSGLDRTAREDE